MNKVVFVPAPFAPVGKDQEVEVPTGEVKKLRFGRGEQAVTRKEMQ